MTGQEKRHFCRIPFISHAQIALDNKQLSCNLLDISLKGVLIEPLDSITLEQDKLYAFELSLSREVHINMNARVIHAEDNHIGLEWNDIDLDSLSSLRRLLEYNLNDPEEINRELGELLSNRF
jgi:hypothetical protein